MLVSLLTIFISSTEFDIKPMSIQGWHKYLPTWGWNILLAIFFLFYLLFIVFHTIELLYFIEFCLSLFIFCLWAIFIINNVLFHFEIPDQNKTINHLLYYNITLLMHRTKYTDFITVMKRKENKKIAQFFILISWITTKK